MQLKLNFSQIHEAHEEKLAINHKISKYLTSINLCFINHATSRAIIVEPEFYCKTKLIPLPIRKFMSPTFMAWNLCSQKVKKLIRLNKLSSFFGNF